ncbi:hypothetical protein HOW07_14895 [Plantibacter sp. MCCC 1A11337]|jgi:hypothetical protein|uniref:hypothetical protein n=1 Tax=unclassified Plantibacter TaxID=2624265 RepID=UPI001581F056|nr:MULTISPECIES: hypothetical protein [unclassified Plantibacter]MBD8468425.1 hypothetical protein [Plantibacter sp. CFBP 8798]NUJ89299.1 hypothetical protein [Plantibacter sp. MCCC 1A11337]
MSADRPTPERIVEERRVLELVDRILGLEAELARVSVYNNPTREQFEALERENEGLRQQVAALHTTRTWKAGRAVLAPLRIVSRGRS